MSAGLNEFRDIGLVCVVSSFVAVEQLLLQMQQQLLLLCSGCFFVLFEVVLFLRGVFFVVVCLSVVELVAGCVARSSGILLCVRCACWSFCVGM